ncbi:MAG: CinA family protein [Marinobacterium sp.]|nr:CinA family protein [Marinobacterium sp.]
MKDLAQKTADALQSRGLKISTAESCTGGWIARELTSIAGSSSWFDCGFVSYSDKAKQRMLGVDEQLLKAQGAVSEAVVSQMAIGALQNSEADLAVAVCGFAGPYTPSTAEQLTEKPVGTMYFAWAVRGQPVVTCLSYFSGEREEVRKQAVQQALDGIMAYMPK